MHSDTGDVGSAKHALRSKRSPLSVLVIEPNRWRAEQIAHGIPQPALITFAPSGEAALAAIQQHLPTLIITAFDLPGLSALDLIAQLHATPATRDILVMVVTERTAVRDKIAALRAGADDFVVTPINPSEFAIRVRLLSRFRPSLR